MKNDIYEFIISKSELTRQHKDDLIQKRGFSDATISKFKFRSCRPEMAALENPLRKAFPEQDLISSGVFVKDKNDNLKPAMMNPTLLEPRVLIPYLSEDGAYHLRPHKFGFENIAIEIYQELNADGNPDEVILTEGEFKAAAGMQYGIPSIAIPGISSFSEQHFGRIVEFLNRHKIKRVIILFDNEEKDNPSWPDRFKDNPNDRYDTQFYAYYMASRLEREGKETRVAWLPDGWRVRGKADMDGALAQLKTTGEMRKILYDSRTHREFLSDLPAEAKQVILRKLAQKRHRSTISREFGHYVAVRKRGKHEVYETISNFVVKIIATHETAEGIIREVVFTNEQGKTSASFEMASEHMTEAFATFCLNKGDFVWRGTREDLLTLWESEFLMMDEGRHIVEPDHIGWIKSERLWLFGNLAISEDGRETRADKNGIFWIEKKGIKPVPLAVTTGRNMIAEGIPYLSLSEFDIKTVLSKLSETIGQNQAKQALGWVSAILFMEEVFDRYACFPFLFITGRRGCGKSTIAEWLINFFGLENSGKMASETTAVAIQRYLSYYSSLPVFVDEYRNTEQIRFKTGLLRNAYNRQSAGKGVREGFGIREAKIRGTLILVGEETPEDNALLTRCVPILISERMRSANHFRWFMSNRTRFSAHIHNILIRRKNLIPQFFEIFEEARQFFTEDGRDERTAINYAVVVAGYAVGVGDFKDLDFAKWISDETCRIQSEFNEEQPTAVFMEDLIAMKTKGVIDDRYWNMGGSSQFGKNCIFIYFEGLYNEWAQEYRRVRGVVPFKKAAIRDYMRDEPGFLALRYHHSIKGTVKSCIVFDDEKCPELIKNLVEYTPVA